MTYDIAKFGLKIRRTSPKLEWRIMYKHKTLGRYNTEAKAEEYAQRILSIQIYIIRDSLDKLQNIAKQN